MEEREREREREGENVRFDQCFPQHSTTQQNNTHTSSYKQLYRHLINWKMAPPETCSSDVSMALIWCSA